MNPLSDIWAREEMITPEIFHPGSTHSTFSNNPLGTAAALEVMRMLQERDYESEVRRAGALTMVR